jgi:hypothetical protein
VVSLAIENFPRKHCDFSTYLAKRAGAQSGASAEVQFPDYGIELWSSGSRNYSRKALRFQESLPRERELKLAQEQRCRFLIMEQCCGPSAVEIVPEKHCDLSTYLTKRARAQFGACAEVQLLDYGRVLWAPGSRNNSRKSLLFHHLSCQECESSVWSMCRGAVT